MKLFDWIKNRKPKLSPEEKAAQDFKKCQEFSEKAREQNAKKTLETMQKLEAHTLRTNEKIMQWNAELNKKKEQETTKAAKKMEAETQKTAMALHIIHREWLKGNIK